MHALQRLVRRPRLLSSALLALLLFLALLPLLPKYRAMLLAFDAAAAFFLILMALLMARATPHTMRRRAQLQDEGKWAVLAISLCVAAVVLGALAYELHAAKDKSLADMALAGSSIVLAWLFVVVMFSQQYAHSFYLASGQLAFPGTDQPDYWDFLYFAMVLSMCCQTSDVALTSGWMRRLATLHCMLSFFFNVIIIAISVNLVAGVL